MEKQLSDEQIAGNFICARFVVILIMRYRKLVKKISNLFQQNWRTHFHYISSRSLSHSLFNEFIECSKDESFLFLSFQKISKVSEPIFISVCLVYDYHISAWCFAFEYTLSVSACVHHLTSTELLRIHSRAYDSS